jgi:8-oxo-dGTP pyrophosphatase MutT (NUDIX family)
VLALLYPLRAEPHLVLTRRTDRLPIHSGQISLPGGGVDPDDCSAAAAALRETEEELGVVTRDLQAYGPLKPVFTVASNYLLLPFVAFLERRPVFTPNPHEVAEVIEVPLAHLLVASTLEEEIWRIRGERRRVVFFRYGEHQIWGATARVLGQIVELAGGPAFEQRLAPGEVEPTVPAAGREP